MKIKDWQVMQAHDNGAKIERADKVGISAWVMVTSPIPMWNFSAYDYRIANLTADGIRLDEFVEKWPDRIGVPCHGGNYKFVSTDGFIVEMCEDPSKIAKVSVKQENKLRPWTMTEFEPHRDEWFVVRGTREKINAIAYDETGIVFVRNMSLSYREAMNHLDHEDGSPCGVIE